MSILIQFLCRPENTYNTTLSVKVRVDLLLEGGLVKVTGTNGDTKGNSLLLGATGHILVNGNGRVDTTALEEKSSDSSARTLRSNEDDINILGRNDVGLDGCQHHFRFQRRIKDNSRPPCRQQRNRGQSRESCPW